MSIKDEIERDTDLTSISTIKQYIEDPMSDIDFAVIVNEDFDLSVIAANIIEGKVSLDESESKGEVVVFSDSTKLDIEKSCYVYYCPPVYFAKIKRQ
jgi:hypothetical protein